ncbi:M15 family metallopeptidase [Streptomyces lavendulocolor]|uniref:M15 family metallopeptidase n=1 Tax=Streptomyces lavendulocolor TaxID=67316 RepID=UPI0034050BFB
MPRNPWCDALASDPRCWPDRCEERRPRPLLATIGLLATALVVTGCSSSADTTAAAGDARTPPTRQSAPSFPAPSPSPSLNAVVTKIPDEQWSRMVAVGMWRKGCPDVREQLRRVEMNYIDFEGDVRRGTLVVNADVTDSVIRIFTRLFEERFPIRRMESVEAYKGDLDASLRADNTSAFNCRRPDQINAPFKESPHANGRAIDINPVENPWQDLRKKTWSPTGEFSERTAGKGKILEGGLVWQAFTEEGWIWQNIKVADYMHFDTGYPSAPFKGPKAPSVPAEAPSGTTTRE